MRRSPFALGVALLGVAMAGAGFASGGGSAPSLGGADVNADPNRRERRGKGQRNRRGKGAVARPRKRSNRLIVSKRVRRKHARARK